MAMSRWHPATSNRQETRRPIAIQLRSPRLRYRGNFPVDWGLSDPAEKLVCPGKGTAAEKACVSRIGAWVSRLDDQMAGRIDHGFFGLGVLAPQDKDYGLLPFVEKLDDPIGKLLPTLSPVRVGLAPGKGLGAVYRSGHPTSQRTG